MKKVEARIIGTGSYIPKKILSNADLEKMVDTSDEWIVTRTGMKERHLARADEFSSDMGVEAAKKALDSVGMKAEDIDLILVATITPDHIFPSVSCLIQKGVGATRAAVMDLQVACMGYIYGLSVAKAYIESGLYSNILFVASDKLSTLVDYQDRNTCVLFGDGAAACVVSKKGEGLKIGGVNLGADGNLAELLVLPAGGSKMPASQQTVDNRLHYIQMNGKEVFKHAVRRMESATKECLEASGISEDEISWMVPHQANLRIIEALAKRFRMPKEKVYLTIHKYGNTSASSVGIALDELIRQHALTPGEHVVLAAFGAGLTWGATVLSYG